MNCKSCGLKITHDENHPGLCCDCFDETFGMPPQSRRRPRPVPLGTPYIKCEKTTDGKHNAEDCKECAWQKARQDIREAAKKRKDEQKEIP